MKDTANQNISKSAPIPNYLTWHVLRDRRQDQARRVNRLILTRLHENRSH